MACSTARALRTGLHLLLALVLVLQSATALALRHAMPMAAAPEAAEPAAVASSLPPDPRLPPCHAARAAAAPADMPLLPAGDDCCDAGGLCQWACAMAPMAPVAELRLPLPETVPGALPAPRPAAPRWPVTQPLRPPIA